VFEPELIHIVSKLLYNIFKIVFAVNIKDIKIFDKVLDINNKIVISFAIFDDCIFSGLIFSFNIKNFTVSGA